MPGLSPMQYINSLYDRNQPALAFGAQTEAEWKTWRRKLKRKFWDLLGGLEEPRCELAPVISRRKRMDGYTREHVVFTSRQGLQVTAWVLVPEGLDAAAPGMICLQGHGAGKDAIVGIVEEPYQANFALQAVKRGFVVIVPDMFGFGERRDKADIAEGPGKSSCRQPSLAGMMMGITVPGIRVYDVMRCVDYLQTRPECDPKRIGCMGISGGGTITTFAAAVDERIGAALISGYLSYWHDSVFNILHCEDNYVPGVLKWAEMPDIAGLIAPRPVFFENGTRDSIFPLKSARQAFKHVKSVYELLGCVGRCQMQVFEGEHKFCGERGFGFMEQWLK